MGKAIGNVVGGLAGGILGGAGKTPQVQSPISQAQFQEAYKQSQAQAEAQRKFLEAVQAQQGLNKQLDVYGQFSNIAQGQGPNPAQAMLANTTGANVANQAALMASQRGSSSNPALIARQAAQQGGNLQQQAAGQAAALQAQQQLGALGQMGDMSTNMANQQAAQTQNAFANAQALTGMGQQAIQDANARNQAAQMQNQQAQQAMMGNLLSAAGTGLTMAGGAGVFGEGLKNYLAPTKKAEGGMVESKGPSSYAVRHMLAEGGPVPALVSPGEKYLPPQAVKAVKQGANPMDVGHTIPGTPKVPGAKDSYANDTVPKTLQEGGIVLPRSVTKSKNPDKAAQDFVSAIFARQGKMKR